MDSFHFCKGEASTPTFSLVCKEAYNSIRQTHCIIKSQELKPASSGTVITNFFKINDFLGIQNVDYVCPEDLKKM